ncbi:hypothetical protein JYU14_04370 [Simkania negevensis]|uniref:Uncharacterized protein n=1 Tax=Simkania negevensis TaxID=83561 RepID=A0ABS3ASV6_9BACT|nr:hypothetical protein [Simkania negevensis]
MTIRAIHGVHNAISDFYTKDWNRLTNRNASSVDRITSLGRLILTFFGVSRIDLSKCKTTALSEGLAEIERRIARAAADRALGREGVIVPVDSNIRELLRAAERELVAAFSRPILIGSPTERGPDSIPSLSSDDPGWQAMSLELQERFTKTRSTIRQQESDYLMVRIDVLTRRANVRNVYIERQRLYDERYNPRFAEARNNCEAAQNALIEANGRFKQALLAYEETIHSGPPGAPDQFQQAMGRCLRVIEEYFLFKEGVVSLPASAAHPTEEHSALLRATDNLEKTFKQLIEAQCAFETANETRLRADHPALSSLLTEIRTVDQRLCGVMKQKWDLYEEQDKIKNEHPSVNYYDCLTSTSTPSCDWVRFQEIVLQQRKLLGEGYSLAKTRDRLGVDQKREVLRAAKILFPTIADDVTEQQSLSTEQNKQYIQLVEFYNDNQRKLEEIHDDSDLLWFRQQVFSDEQGKQPDNSNPAEIVRWNQRVKEKGTALAEVIYDLLSQCEGITRENYPELLKLLGQISETRKLNERYHIATETKEQLLIANALFLGIYANRWGINQFVDEDRSLFSFLTSLVSYEPRDSQLALRERLISAIKPSIWGLGLSEESFRERSEKLDMIKTACSKGTFLDYLRSLQPLQPLPNSRNNREENLLRPLPDLSSQVIITPHP